jgi:uncharacterized membrane protein
VSIHNARESDSAPPEITDVIDQELKFPAIHSLGTWRFLHWFKLAWYDLKSAPATSLFYGLCFAIMGWILKLSLSHAPEYISALSCGFLLVGPLLALGLYDVSRRLESKQKGMAETLFSMKGRWSNIGTLALVLAVILMVWARASLIVFALFSNKPMPNAHAFLQQLLALQNLEFVFVYAFVGFLFAALVFAFSWLSIPLMLDRDTDAISAMLISCVALFKNFPLAVCWALSIVLLVVVGFLTWNLFLIIAMPLVGHATWHAYRDLIGD